jgi:ligand-binding SRPBCC domain-containing protein
VKSLPTPKCSRGSRSTSRSNVFAIPSSDLHAGIAPDSQIGDYTDVVVRSPYGEIPWPNLSRLNDEEMKALMIDVVNKTYHALIVLFDDRLGGELIKILAQRDFLPHWNEPTLTTTG